MLLHLPLSTAVQTSVNAKIATGKVKQAGKTLFKVIATRSQNSKKKKRKSELSLNSILLKGLGGVV